MSVSPLTVLAHIVGGQEEALRHVLRTTGAELFERSASTQMATWVILIDRDREGHRLLLSSNHDLPLDDYLEELVEVAGPELDAIWSHCDGWSGLAGIGDFIRGRSYRSQVYFASFPQQTRASIHNYAMVRRSLESFTDLGQVDRRLREPGFEAFLDALAKLRRKKPWLVRLAYAVTGFFRAVGRGLHRVFFAVMLAVFQKIIKWVFNGAFTSVRSNIGQSLQPFDETFVVQSQMTNVSDVRRGRLWFLRISLWVTNFLATYGFPPGDLAGVKTIHFARWTLIDDNRRMLFQGNFDGSWSNYMGDFADRIAWGLDSTWGQTYGYPPAGMTDLASFKRYIRERQFEPDAVFSAYPALSVMNILRDIALGDGIGHDFEREAAEHWLQLL
jgi:hypothetical protein